MADRTWRDPDIAGRLAAWRTIERAQADCLADLQGECAELLADNRAQHALAEYYHRLADDALRQIETLVQQLAEMAELAAQGVRR